MARVRAAVVGAGGISRQWFEALVKAKVAVSAVVDVRPEAARARIEEFRLEAEASADLRSVLRRHRPDLVIDCTPPETHCQVVCASLSAGAHVLGEKPMALDLAQARRMVRTAEKTRRVYMIDQSHRFLPASDQVRRTVESGALGRVTAIDCDFHVPAHPSPFRMAMPSPLLMDMSIHHFDLARAFSGADASAVFAHEYNPRGSWFRSGGAVSCVFEMTGGVVFTYRAGWCSIGCRTRWPGSWRIIGERGTLLYDGANPPTGEVAEGSPAATPLKLRPLRVPAPRFRDFFMEAALREMLTFLRTGRKPQAECHDNIESLAMVFAALRSARTRRRAAVRV